MKFILGVLVLILPAVNLHAQSLSPVQQEIVVTASSVPDSVESTPAAVTVITKEEIEQRSAHDVADVLREVPGLTLTRSGSRGKVMSLFTRGGSSTHTLVLWNGIEINNPFFAGYDWGRFSTVGVDRIEVVRGPYSPLYGSEAMSGVVNVLTTEGTNRLDMNLEGGEDGFLNLSLAAGIHRGRFGASASVEHRADDGLESNDDFDQDVAIGGVRWAFAPAGSLGVNARYSSYDTGVPRNPNPEGTAFVPTPNRRLAGTELQLSSPLRFTAGNLTYAAHLARSQRSDDFSDPDDPFGFIEASTESTTDQARISASRVTRLGTITAGGEYEIATVDDESSYGINLSGDERENRSAFFEDRVSIDAASGQLEVVLGARWDDYDTFGSELSPRFGAAWIRDRNKFRAAYGTAFRAPSIGELYFPFFGNRDLDAEKTRSWELGYERHFGPGRNVAITYFESDYDNLIVYDNVSNKFQNIGAAASRGVEIGWNGDLARFLTAGLSYTWLDTEQASTGEALLRRPEHSGSVSLHARRDPWRASLVAIYSGDRADLTDLFPYGRVTSEPYTTADLTIHYSLGRLAPYVKAENLTDEDYQEIFGYPSPGRRLLAGIRVALWR